MGQDVSQEEYSKVRAYDAAGRTLEDARTNLELLLRCFDDGLRVNYIDLAPKATLRVFRLGDPEFVPRELTYYFRASGFNPLYYLRVVL